MLTPLLTRSAPFYDTAFKSHFPHPFRGPHPSTPWNRISSSTKMKSVEVVSYQSHVQFSLLSVLFLLLKKNSDGLRWSMLWNICDFVVICYVLFWSKQCKRWAGLWTTFTINGNMSGTKLTVQNLSLHILCFVPFFNFKREFQFSKQWPLAKCSM